MANDSYKKYTIKGHISIKDDQGAIKVALNKYGPLSAAIYASSKGFRYYSHGIYDGADCFSSPDKLNHGILIIGYGEVNGA
ncbi:C1 family peptidase, partial [Staphylococcus aureus]|uniref:C1 family peptidase n=1 Tax=Staphylococcus aureus TaxID=1280 RepID=UPI0038B2FDFB